MKSLSEGHILSSASLWKFGRSDMYRVNPPLVRLVAALPMLLVDPKTDWSGFTEIPYARPEFPLGTVFANANGSDTFWHFTLARWACIPFGLGGGWICFRWAHDLYGPAAGIISLILWCFCPNILGNGALITPDVGAAAYCFWRWLSSVGGFLRNPHPVTPPASPMHEADSFPKHDRPSGGRGSCRAGIAGNSLVCGSAGASPSLFQQTSGWPRALLAGLTLGLAELTKSTWIILFALWPLLWLIWQLSSRQRQFSIFNLHFSIFNTSSAASNPKSAVRDASGAPADRRKPTDDALGCASRLNPRRVFSILHPRSSILQLSAILLLALYILNLGYGFENSFQRLDKFQFISQALGGPDAHKSPGNRFANIWLGALPVPVPANYLRGLDVQRYDFEVGKWSYLRGEQKMGGWWYYYLYAMAVKMPVGTLFLIALATVLSVASMIRAMRKPTDVALGCASRLNDDLRSSILDIVTLVAPALIVLVVVSSQTGFNRYLRYVLPAFPFLFVWASQVARFITVQCTPGRAPIRRELVPRARLTRAVVVVCLVATIASSLAVFPHSLSYFNELAGGPENGPAHLLDANVDWGQDLLELKRWHDAHPEARPFHVAYFGRVSPKAAGIESAPEPLFAPPPLNKGVVTSSPLRKGGPGGGALPTLGSPIAGTDLNRIGPSGWYAISINDLYGYKHDGHEVDRYAPLRTESPVARAGYSIRIYRLLK